MILFNLKIIVQNFISHGRRAILQNSSRRFETGHSYYKLTHKSKELACEWPIGHCNAENTSSTLGQNGNIFRFIRPLVRNILSRVQSPVWLESRKKSTRRLFGQSAPYFALVGISLTANPEKGILTQDDEFDMTCYSIRKAIYRAGWIHDPTFWKRKDDGNNSCSSSESEGVFDGPVSLDSFEFGDPISKGANGAIYEAKLKRAGDSASGKFPLAVKMMFNYDAESNAPAIFSSMYKELLPAKRLHFQGSFGLGKPSFEWERGRLGAHWNVVEMPAAFADRVPMLKDSERLFPAALPPRLEPAGLGRNMSLFCVMKRYDMTLKDYLRRNEPSTRTSLLVFVQILEAVCHMTKCGVFHRDLKADNILLSVDAGFETPHVVVTDFGCCLVSSRATVAFPSYEADPRAGNAALMAPEIKSANPGLFTWLDYSKADLWAVGTLAYEIFGMGNPFIFDQRPNEAQATARVLDSATYSETELPKLPKTTPPEIRCLVSDLLKRDPRQRPCVKVAATLVQLSLWAPRKWLNRHALVAPSKRQIMEWLLCVSTKVICEAGYDGSMTSETDEPTCDGAKSKTGAPSSLEYEIISTFLRRVYLRDVLDAVKWNRAF